MSDEPHNLILDHLRQLRDGQERIGNNIQDIKDRIGTSESQINALRRDQASIFDIMTSHNKRFDRLDERFNRIEKLLSRVEA